MIRVRDIVVPPGVTILTDPDTPVLSVITPAALRTEADLLLPGEEGAVVEEAPEGEGGVEGEEAPEAEPAPDAES